MYFCDCLSGLGKSIRDEGITIVLEIKAQLTPGLCNLLLSDDFPWRGDGHKIRTSVVCKTGVGTEIWYFLHPLCLQFFPCIIFERYFHLPVESRTGSVYVDSSCLYSKVSEQWTGNTCCHIEMSLQGRGSSKTINDLSPKVTLKELAMLTGSVIVESWPSTSGMMDCWFLRWKRILASTCSMAVLILICQSLTLSPSFTRLSSTLSRTLANVSLFKKMRLEDNLELTRSGPILPSLNLRPLSAKRAGAPVCKRCQVLRLLLLYRALWHCVVAFPSQLL